MKIEFSYSQGYLRYDCIFDYDRPNWIEIFTYEKGALGAFSWIHRIKMGKVIWRHDDFMQLSSEAKKYIQQEVDKIFSKWRSFL